MPRWPAFVLSIAIPAFLSLTAQASDGNFRPPVAKVAEYEFADARAPGIVSGAWATSAGWDPRRRGR